MVPGLAWKSSVRCELALAYGVRRRPSVTQLFVSHVSVLFSRPHAPPSLSLPTVRGGVGLFLGSALRASTAGRGVIAASWDGVAPPLLPPAVSSLPRVFVVPQKL